MRKIAVLSLLLAQMTAAQAVNLVINPSFETGTFAGWTQFGTSLTADGVINGLTEPVGQSPNGNFHAFFGAFGPDSPSGIFQNLATNIGQTYTISFILHTGLINSPTRTFLAEFGGNTLLSRTNPGVGQGFGSGFQTFNFSQVATASTTQIRFTFFNDPDFWRFDNVIVDDGTPELSVQGMMIPLLWVGMVLLTSQRRKPLARNSGEKMPA